MEEAAATSAAEAAEMMKKIKKNVAWKKNGGRFMV